jgi:hypothetical protein
MIRSLRLGALALGLVLAVGVAAIASAQGAPEPATTTSYTISLRGERLTPEAQATFLDAYNRPVTVRIDVEIRSRSTNAVVTNLGPRLTITNTATGAAVATLATLTFDAARGVYSGTFNLDEDVIRARQYRATVFIPFRAGLYSFEQFASFTLQPAGG